MTTCFKECTIIGYQNKLKKTKESVCVSILALIFYFLIFLPSWAGEILTVDGDLPLIFHGRVLDQFIPGATREKLSVISLLWSEGEDGAGDISLVSRL